MSSIVDERDKVGHYVTKYDNQIYKQTNKQTNIFSMEI